MGIADKGFGQTAGSWIELPFVPFAHAPTSGHRSHPLRNDAVTFVCCMPWALRDNPDWFVSLWLGPLFQQIMVPAGSWSASAKITQGALLLGPSRCCSILDLLRLLLVALHSCYRVWGDRRVWLGPKPSCGGLAFWQSGSLWSLPMLACFAGMICIRKGLGLGFTFRSGLSFCAVGHVGKRLVTFFTLGGC
jgi:hypothetical protein